MGTPSQFTARTESRNGVARIALSGELDLDTVPMMVKELSAAENDGVNAIMLDLRDVTFVDSSGLRAFLQASERAKTNGHRMVLIGTNPSTQRLLALTQTEFLLNEQAAPHLLERFTGHRRAGPAASSEPAADD